MSRFTEAELEYLKTQRLGRQATVNKQGEPQIAPVGFRYNAELDTIDIGGHNIAASQKFRNIARNGLAAFNCCGIFSPFWVYTEHVTLLHSILKRCYKYMTILDGVR